MIGPFELRSFILKLERESLVLFVLHILLLEMAGTTSLVNQFDDIVAATGVLCAGTEGGERKLHGVVSQMSGLSSLLSPKLVSTHIFIMDVPLFTAFAEFVAHQIGIHTRAQEMVEENARLKVCTSCYRSLDKLLDGSG